MKQRLVISALGPDRPGLVHHLTRTISDSECSLLDARMRVLDDRFCGHLLAEGSWHAIAKLEAELPKLAQRVDLQLESVRSAPSELRRECVPYSVDAVALDRPGIVSALAAFFAEQEIGLSEVNTEAYVSIHTGAPMFALQMTLDVPADLHLGGLRDAFMELCDHMNVDAVIEPLKQ